MAAKTLYLLNALASGSNHMDLQDGGAAPGTATTGTGWTVAKIALGNYARMDSQTERVSGSFGTVAQPDGAPDNTLGDCFRSPAILNGSFAAANWDFQFPVIAVSSGGDQDGAIRFRLWRSVNADGSAATEITAATQQASTITNLTTGAQQISSLLFNPGAVTLTNEYLFIQLAWRITGAGGANTRDVLLRIGSAARVITSDFTASASPTRGQVSWAELETPLAPTRGQVSWAELETPLVPTRGQLSWTELEAPLAPTRGQVSWAEQEVPSVAASPTRGQISWAEAEIPFVATRGLVSWLELEAPLAPTQGRVSWAELEAPIVPTRGLASWAELEVPAVATRGRLSWTELETPELSAMSHYYEMRCSTRWRRMLYWGRQRQKV